MPASLATYKAIAEIGQHIQFGHCGSGFLQSEQSFVQCFQQLFVKRFFPCQGTALSRQRLVLKIF